MKSKPIIGINGDYRPARKDAGALSWFHTGYYESVIAAGGLPLLIPPFVEDADLKQIAGMLDGLVLAGCQLDLDPVRLGMEPHPHTRPMPPRREDFDRRLCKLAVEKKIPTLAIGLGMQLMNVTCGGTLYQHVAEEVPKSLHHRDLVEKPNRHIIEIVEGTRMWDIYGPGEIRINSDHHMAVNQVATPFRVCASSPDGVIEAYETKDGNWYCVGVQWHPEDETASALDMQLFENLLDACRKGAPAILPMRAAA